MNKKYKFGEGSVREQEKQYIEDKLGKVEKLLAGYDGETELLCETEIFQDKKGFWHLEVMIETPHNLYRAEETRHILTEAMDAAEEALKKQVRRHREKTMDLRQRRGRSLKKNVAIDTKARF